MQDDLVLPSRAADGDDKVGLPLVHVVWQQKRQQILGFLEKILRLLVLEDEIPHRLIEPCKRFEFRNVIRVRQKPHVENQVRIQRQAVFKAERQNRHMHRPFAHAARDKVNEFSAELPG